MVPVDNMLDHAGSFRSELAVAISLAKEAGDIVLRYHGHDLEVGRKEGDEPVTVADLESSQHIVSGLRAAFPDDAVVSEELADDGSRLRTRRVWYVDPIDGTKNFIRGLSSYCVMIGLAIDHRPVLGVLFQPNHQSLICACAGQGSFVSYEGQLRRLHVSQHVRPEDARLLTSSSNPPPDRDQIEAVLGLDARERIGSIGLKLAAIALGATDLYVNPATHCSSWDTCAPQVVLEEAGGVMSDMFGAPLSYDSPSTLHHDRGLVASNGQMHASAVARLASIFPRKS